MSKSSFVWMLLYIVLLMGAAAGGFWLYQEKPATVAQNQIVPTEQIKSKSAPAQELNLSKHKIKILNGSGTAGEAVRAKNLLEKAGFTVSETGNADSFDVDLTQISAKNDLDQAFLDKLRKTLAKTYEVQTTIEDSTGNEIMVVIGSIKAE